MKKSTVGHLMTGLNVLLLILISLAIMNKYSGDTEEGGIIV